jgi:hypothetical protein
MGTSPGGLRRLSREILARGGLRIGNQAEPVALQIGGHDVAINDDIDAIQHARNPIELGHDRPPAN